MNEKPDMEFSYLDAAGFLELSKRQAKRVLAHYTRKGVCRPLRYGHRTVRFKFSELCKVRDARRHEALKTNGKGAP